MAIKFDTFGELTQICVDRAKIAGTAQPKDLEIIKGALNEYYLNICTERNWTWRKFDRSFEFKLPSSTGTVSVVNGSRVATFAGVTIDDTFRTRTLSIVGTLELYRIIGVDIATNAVYLDGNYIAQTNATAQYKLFQYEFPLPPDCDTVAQIYIDGNLFRDRQLDEVNNEEFNRMLSTTVMLAGPPQIYTQDGSIAYNPTGRVLDDQLLNYDFLGGEDFDEVFKLRLFPIWPDMDRLVHISYSKCVEPMVNDNDICIIPVDDRSVLIHFALYEWWKIQGNLNMANMEKSDAKGKLKEMRDEFRKTDTKPTLIVNASRYRRAHKLDRNIDVFRLSRLQETQ